MTSSAQRGFTEAEYLALERASDSKHEFTDGTIIGMAGAKPPHNALAVRVGGLLDVLSRGKGCVVLSSDQRVHVPATGLYAYPDVTVACGERVYREGEPPSLLNPTFLVEVTSDSTEDYDRGKKFLHYQAIGSLREYLIVSHRERRIDHFRRLDSGQWLATAAVGDGAVADLPVLAGSIRVSDVYDGIDLEEGSRK